MELTKEIVERSGFMDDLQDADSRDQFRKIHEITHDVWHGRWNEWVQTTAAVIIANGITQGLESSLCALASWAFWHGWKAGQQASEVEMPEKIGEAQ